MRRFTMMLALLAASLALSSVASAWTPPDCSDSNICDTFPWPWW